LEWATAALIRFPTPAHLASWAGMCPGNNVTGGKRPSGTTNHGNRWLGEILNQCAWAAAHTPRHLPGRPVLAAGATHRQEEGRRRGRPLDPVIAWHLLARGCDDQDLGGDWVVRSSDPERHKLRLVKQLQELGYAVTLRPAA
jgi:transposase